MIGVCSYGLGRFEMVDDSHWEQRCAGSLDTVYFAMETAPNRPTVGEVCVSFDLVVNARCRGVGGFPDSPPQMTIDDDSRKGPSRKWNGSPRFVMSELDSVQQSQEADPVDRLPVQASS